MRKANALLAIAGMALFAFAASRIGWGELLHTISQARTAVAAILGLSLLRLVLQTYSWSIALRTEGTTAGFGELMLIRLASQGMGYLTVLGPFASEPMKIGLLRKRGGSVATATLVDSGVYWFASGVVGIAGFLAAIMFLVKGRHSVVPSLVVAAIFALGLFFIARPTPRLGALANALGPRSPKWLVKGQQMEIAIRDFEREHPRTIRTMLLLDAACQVLLAAEVAAIFIALSIPLRASAVLAVEGAGRAIKIATGWMPARIGADESGIAAAFLVFGLSPASGLTLALARRTRDLLAALVGLTWLALSAGLMKVSKEKILCAQS